MLRYYAIATCIVLAIAVFVTAWTHRDLIRIRIAPTTLPAPPKAADERASQGSPDIDVYNDAPWALSALPDCLIEERKARGPVSYVRSKLPSGASEIEPGTKLVYGPCTIFVEHSEIRVRRGPDRLRIPPIVTLFRSDEGLALLRISGKTAELRVYVVPKIR